MAEMPIDPEFGRNIQGIPDPASQVTETPDGGAEIDLMQFDDGVEELEDGSAIVNLDEYKGPSEDEDFYKDVQNFQRYSDLKKIYQGKFHLYMI